MPETVSSAAPQTTTAPPAQAAPAAQSPEAKGREILIQKGLIKPAEGGAAVAAQGEPAKAAEGRSQEGEGDSVLARRLAAIARKEDSIRARTAELATQRERLNRIEAFEKAKATGGNVAALKALFGDEVYGQLYSELTDEVINNAKPETEEEKIARLVREKFEATEKEKAKAAEDAKRAEVKAAVESEPKHWRSEASERFISGLVELYNSTPEKWPGLERATLDFSSGGDLEMPGVDRKKLFSYIEKCFRETGQVPSEAEVLTFFESGFRPASVEADQSARDSVEDARRGSQQGRNSNSPPAQAAPDKPGPDASLAERTAWIKRRFLKS